MATTHTPFWAVPTEQLAVVVNVHENGASSVAPEAACRPGSRVTV